MPHTSLEQRQIRHTPLPLWSKLKPLARQMRHEPTPAEKRLWQSIRGRQVADAKFRRQHPLERFILDFYCHEAQLVIEVDGDIHQYTQDEDAIRQQFLESTGLIVIRFSNDQVMAELDGVLQVIHEVLVTRLAGDSDNGAILDENQRGEEESNSTREASP